eukprot:TRINITY_DN10040_c0_g1_i3.p1 TRINITY_DN10040_c0_g1~~TRINITY_DN10040_c0_g1_i3.p1  ORF type:complete len:628 (+),score=94.15 TRINITY_DN10040_c0_g1_i3:166-2049(+)
MFCSQNCERSFAVAWLFLTLYTRPRSIACSVHLRHRYLCPSERTSGIAISTSLSRGSSTTRFAPHPVELNKSAPPLPEGSRGEPVPLAWKVGDCNKVPHRLPPLSGAPCKISVEPEILPGRPCKRLSIQSESSVDTSITSADAAEDFDAKPVKFQPLVRERRKLDSLHSLSSIATTARSFRRPTGKVGDSLVRSARCASGHMDQEDSQEELSYGATWRLVKILQSSSDTFIACVILMNGIFIGLQTNHTAVSLSEEFPTWYFVVDFAFFIVFFIELLIRIWIFRGSFFTVPSWAWNVFDSALVALQLVELLATFIVGSSVRGLAAADSLKNLAFVRLLRVMRVLRTLRLARLMQFVGELHVVKQAIEATVRPLLGALLLLALMCFCAGIFFTQLVAMYRIELKEANQADERLSQYWGNLGRSMLSLFESCFGGVDWDDVATPLSDIHQGVMLLFIAFVTFITIAMVNVITGIFVESAVSKAEAAKVASLSKLLHKSFEASTNYLTRSDFDDIVEDDDLSKQLFEFGINIGEAETLFDFLAGDGKEVQVDHLLAGMMRLRSNAKFIDTLTLADAIKSVHRKVKETNRKSSQELSEIKKNIATSPAVPTSTPARAEDDLRLCYPSCDEA